MTDEEFNRYCAEVINLVIKGMTGDGSLWTIEPHRQLLDGWFYNPSKDLNQMAEVFDKLFKGKLTNDPYKFSNIFDRKGIASAMREYIESTK